MATFAVVGAPILAVSALRASGAVTSLVPLMAVAVALSVTASYLGAALWATRKGSGDVLFADLMLWGWLRRWWTERQLAGAVRLLGLRESSKGPDGLSAGRRARLLKQLAAALEARSPDTYGHSRRVARHATAIAKRMGLPREEVARIRAAAAVHDVGKVDIPSEILEKPGRLTDAEFDVVKRHPGIGARMVAGLDDEELTRIVRHHHERLDGAGYPGGLAGDRIPIGARIIAVADTFDAITSTRPYRKARRHRDALELLVAEAGTQLDPRAVRAFRRYYSGHRPVALWALLLNTPRQLIASLAGQAKLGGAVAVTTIATVAAGSVAVTAPKANQRAPEPSASGAIATRLTAYAEGGGAAESQGEAARLMSARSEAGVSDVDGAGSAPAGPSDDAVTYSGDTPSTVESGSAPNGGDSGGGGSDDDGLRGAGSSDKDKKGDSSGGNSIRSTARDTVRETVPSVATTAGSAANAVADTVRSQLPDVEAPIPRDVAPALPRAPGLHLK